MWCGCPFKKQNTYIYIYVFYHFTILRWCGLKPLTWKWPRASSDLGPFNCYGLTLIPAWIIITTIIKHGRKLLLYSPTSTVQWISNFTIHAGPLVLSYLSTNIRVEKHEMSIPNNVVQYLHCIIRLYISLWIINGKDYNCHSFIPSNYVTSEMGQIYRLPFLFRYINK